MAERGMDLGVQSPAVKRLGFTYAALALLLLIAPGFATALSVPRTVAALLALALAGATAWLGRSKREDWTFWTSWALSTCCAGAGVSTTFPTLFTPGDSEQALSQWTSGSTLLFALLVATSISTVAAYRVSPWAYVALVFICGFETGYAAGSVTIGVLASLCFAAALVLGNYFVQLYTDNRADFSLLLASLRTIYRWRDRWEMATKILAAWIVVIGLIALGAWVHSEIEASARASVYEAGFVPRMYSEDGVSDEDRELQRDILLAIAAREDQALREVWAFPGTLRETLMRWAPPLLPSAPCERFSVRVGKRITFRGPCRALVSGFNGTIQGAYKSRVERIVGSVKPDEVERGVREIFKYLRWATNAVFFILFALLLYSASLLTLAALNALRLVLTRIAFAEATPNRFSLLRRAGDAEPLEREVFAEGEKISFVDLDAPDGEPTMAWYVWAVGERLALQGRGIGRTHFARFWQCTVARMLSRHLQLLRIDMRRAREAKAKGQTSATIWVPTKCSVVVLNVRQGQQIVFRMRSLLGFTEGVQLKSVYSTHAGLFLLGLGSFYSYAEGAGRIALLADAGVAPTSKRSELTPVGVVGRVSKGQALFAANLLAWDRRARFGVCDSGGSEPLSSTAIGRAWSVAKAGLLHWFTQSQVVLSSADGTAALDSSLIEIDGKGKQLGRLAQYLILPF